MEKGILVLSIFEFSSSQTDDAREQDLADSLEYSANNLSKAVVNVEFPNGIIELQGF